MRHNYRELLSNCAKFGYGVFCVPMVGADAACRNAFRKYIERHPELFRSFSTHCKDVSIRYLTSEGRRLFFGDGRSLAAKTYQSFLDVALVNAHMADRGEWAKQVARPHSVTTLPSGERVALLSRNHGLPKEKVDTLLTDPHFQSFLLDSPERISHAAKIAKISEEDALCRIKSAIVPSSLSELSHLI